MSRNPFLGPEPSGAADRARFFGREDLSYRIAERILGNPCVTVYGPAETGKTSLFQASVLPALVESQDARVVHVGGWPADVPPVQRLADAMYEGLHLGEPSPDLTPQEAVIAATKRAVRGSPRLVVLYLDQVEQLCAAERHLPATEVLLSCLQDLVDLTLRPVRLVLSLREDYLGRFLDLLRGRLRMIEQSFRVQPLTVGELAVVLCKVAAMGEPPQQWSRSELTSLMLQMRTGDQRAGDGAEARLTYAQSFCRALFEQRAEGPGEGGAALDRGLSSYIERTVVELTLPPPADALKTRVAK